MWPQAKRRHGISLTDFQPTLKAPCHLVSVSFLEILHNSIKYFKNFLEVQHSKILSYLCYVRPKPSLSETMQRGSSSSALFTSFLS